MPSPSIAVVIPLYNHASYIEAALESVLGQHSPADEILLIDDGSSDDGFAIAGRMLAGHPGARFSRQQNGGAPAALNRLIEGAQSEFIAVLNSDDVFCPGKLARCREIITARPDIGLVCGRIGVIDGQGTHLKSGVTIDWLDRAAAFRAQCHNDALSLLHENYVATTSNMVFARRLWQISGGFQNLRYCHDLDFLMMAYAHGKVVIDEEDHILYRVHENNTIKERLDRVRLEIAAVTANALMTDGARFIGDDFPRADMVNFAAMLKTKDGARLLCFLQMIRTRFPHRRDFYNALMQPELSETLIEAFLL